MPFMSLSMPDQSFSWNRVLPKPTALLYDHLNDPFGRRNSSLLQHHIVSDKPSAITSDDSVGRRITVPSIAYSTTPSSEAQIQYTVKNSSEPAPTIDVNEGLVIRKRNLSLMDDDSDSRDPSPLTQNHSDETGNQFCLCQPDPKIPRPRNGMYLILYCPCEASYDECVYGNKALCQFCHTLYSIGLMLTLPPNSLHPLSPTLSSCNCCTTSWSRQSRNF